jgi:hypothetical protein
VADISAEIIRLLIEESHLRAAKRTIDASASEKRRQLAALRGRQTPVDYLLKLVKQPRAASLEIEQVEAMLKELEQGVGKIQRLEQRSTERLEDELDRFVRETSEEYRRGLAAVTNIADWERALERFEEKLADYLRSLGEARNTVVAGYDRENKRLGNSAIESLNHAIAAGQMLEEETKFANRIAELHRLTVSDTPCQQAFIPVIPSADYSYWTRRMPELEIGMMQKEFDRILAMCEELAKNGIAELRKAVLNTRLEQKRLAHDYISRYLGELRQYADENWHDPAQTDAIIQRIELGEEIAAVEAVGALAAPSHAGQVAQAMSA